MECIFCKIIEGKIPCYKVYEDENTLAFLDIMPMTKGHTLVIPKKHFQNIEAVPEEVLCQVMLAVKKIGKSIMDNLKVGGYNVNENNSPAAGQIIPHLHFHIIPRNEGDGLALWPKVEYGEGEIKEIAKMINIQ